jgi:hypothetical protein
MTPADRQYDIDLVRSMREQARQVRKRSGKISVTLLQGADRLERLSNSMPVEPIPIPDPTQTSDPTQPASTPALVETVREDGRR